MRFPCFITALLFSFAAQAQIGLLDTTVTISGRSYTVATKDFKKGKQLLIVKSKGKTISIDTIQSDPWDIRFADFNKDGYNDIIVVYGGNNFLYYLYMFDTMAYKFREVEGFEAYPASLQLKSYPSFYYSYHRAGCADMKWVSDLYKIENFKTIHLGEIDGQGCDSPYYITASKIIGNKDENKKQVAKIPYKKIDGYKNYKWGFIEDYWNRNYAKFK